MVNQYTAQLIPSKEYLEHLYQEGNTQKEIGNMFLVTQKVVFRWFKKLGIKSRIPKKKNQLCGNNDNWKGSNAGIAEYHVRLKNIRGKANKCEICGKGKYFEWANLTGKYEDINDYKMMCKSCHAKYDNKASNFKAGDAK